MPINVDPAEIRRTLELLVPPGATTELRALNTSKKILSGYYDYGHLGTMAQHAATIDAPGVYLVINPVIEALLSRSENHVTAWATHTSTDANVTKRIWLPLDFDPVRPAGISSTDAEHELALARAQECCDWLSEKFDWPAPVAADSGNGAYLLFRIDLENDAHATDLLKRILNVVADKFSDDQVEVDRNVFNAARLVRCFGTMNQKGDSTTDRPHRLSRILWNGTAEYIPLTQAQLQAVADFSDGAPEAEVNPPLWTDLANEVLSRLKVISSGPYKSGTKHIVVCPWASESKHDAGVFVFPDSPIGFDCLHESCPGRGKKGKDLLSLLGLTERAFQLTAHGEIKPILSNCVVALETDPVFAGVFAFDDFSKRTITKKAAPWPHSIPGQEWSDYDDDALTVYLQQHKKILAGSTMFAAAVQQVARKHGSFHPVQNYLDDLQWDQVPRVDTWCVVYLGADDIPFIRAAGAAWLISACARIFQPGCKADYTLLLVGPQGRCKSQALKILAVREDWHFEHFGSLDGKDSQETLHGVWLVEMCELASVRKSERAHVRGYLTAQKDRIRLPYGRRSQDLQRSNVFCGTVNEFDYNNDSTGDRRKWPVECGNIDLVALERDRNQLWAETMVRYRAGEKWYLSDALEKEAAKQQDKHYAAQAYDQAIEDWLRRIVPRNVTTNDGTFVLEPFDSCSGNCGVPRRVTLRDILLHGVGFNKDTEYGQRELDLVRDYLRHKRWIGPKQTWWQGRNVKFYYPSEESHQEEQERINDRWNHKMGEKEN